MSDYVEIGGSAPQNDNAAQHGTETVSESPVYSGRLRELIPIVLLNMLLSILTLGIYRFWGKTKIRRYLWSHVSFRGQPLEYTGTGGELFKGFLVVILIIVPVSILLSVLQATFQGNPTAFLVIQVTYMAAFFYLFFVAVYRAQRYRLTRTVWRGIRGGMNGSAVTYANKAFGHFFLTLVTLGILYPKMQVALQKYRTETACIGETPLTFDGVTKPLLKAWIITGILLALLYGSGGFLFIQVLPNFQDRQPSTDEAFKFIIYGFGGAILFFVLSSLVTLHYSKVVLRYFIDMTGFDGLQARSEMTVGRLVKAYLPIIIAYGGWAVLLLAFFTLYAYGDIVATQTLTLVFFVGFFLITAFVPIIVVHRIVAALCDTTTITGAFSPDRLLQNQSEKPGTGEGLAEALEIDAI